MFCPNCGAENQGQNRFCTKCASLLGGGVSEHDIPIRDIDTEDLIPVAAVKEKGEFVSQVPNSSGEIYVRGKSRAVNSTQTDAPFDDSDRLEFNIPEATDSIVWPPEAVFVPSSEMEEAEDSPLEFPYFEDAQADDVFEQSLSGVTLAELEAADGLIEDSEARQQSTTEAFETTTIPQEIPDVVVAPVIPKVVREDPLEAPVDPVIEVGPAADSKKWSNIVFRIGSFALIVFVVFAAGVGTGMWIVSRPSKDVVAPEVIPAVETKPEEPSPPPGMAYVPGGEFIMGSDTGDEFSRPSHPTTVQPFFIDLTEVTNEDYQRFVAAAGHQTPAGWKNGTFLAGKGKFPVTGVSWFDAADYAEWAGKRLPTEEEWEFAARGTENRIYPWGNDWDPDLANAEHHAGGLRDVGEGGRSPFGLFDMSGNAWEWTASDAIPFPGGKAFPKSRLKLKIIRGGNWQSDRNKATAVFRGFYGASGEAEYNGTSFRCAKDIK